MNRFRKLFFSLVFVFVSMLGLMLNINAEETEEYSIKVTTKMGSVASTLHMSLEGFDKAEAVTNRYDYFVKFVKETEGKPVLSGNPYDSEKGVDNIVDSYNSVNIGLNSETNVYYSTINIDEDWYMLDGYTKAYIVKCIAYNECEVLDNPVIVEKPALPKITQRYENFLFTEDEHNSLSVFQYFPSIGDHGNHEVNVKIGLINDNELLKKISKDEPGSYEELMEYAKTSNGKLFTANEDDFIDGINIGNFEITDGTYYYMYTYYTNTDGLYRNLDDIAVAMAKNGHLVNDVEWHFDETLWDKFVENFKNTDLVKLYEESEAQLEITSTENSLSVVLTSESETFTTNFAYEDGILKYKPTSEKDELIFADNIWQINAIYALSELKGYDIKKVSKWIEENRDKVSTLENDGIAYTEKEYTYKEDKDGVSTTVNATILTSFELDLQNGLKSYNEEKISNYEFIFGENQKYKVNETKELKFEIDAEYSLFENVYVNGNLLDVKNYTVSEGSTIVVLKKEYLDTLNNGVHTLKVTFKDGGFAQTEFTIEKTVKNPSTGMGITYGILILALVFAGIYTIIRKQSRFPKHN